MGTWLARASERTVRADTSRACGADGRTTNVRVYHIGNGLNGRRRCHSLGCNLHLKRPTAGKAILS